MSEVIIIYCATNHNNAYQTSKLTKRPKIAGIFPTWMTWVVSLKCLQSLKAAWTNFHYCIPISKTRSTIKPSQSPKCLHPKYYFQRNAWKHSIVFYLDHWIQQQWRCECTSIWRLPKLQHPCQNYSAQIYNKIFQL